MNQRDGLWCVVPAAGRGSRFGADRPKQHVEIAGRNLLDWTLDRLASHPRIAGLMVVLAEHDPYWKPRDLGKPLLTCHGGAERADSVLAGLDALPACVAAGDFVLVHDAARPCVRHADIDALIDAAGQGDGGLLAAPLRDTLKRGDADGLVLETEPRESRWRALTPQMFRRTDLVNALRAAQAASVVVTDESMAMELVGFRPRLVPGDDDNIKVTTASDQTLAAHLLTR